MTLLWCDQPQDDEPRLPCMDTAVYGTSRCLRHQPPGGTVVLKPLAPIPAADMLAGEGLKPAGWVGCGCGNCAQLAPRPLPSPAPEAYIPGSQPGPARHVILGEEAAQFADEALELAEFALPAANEAFAAVNEMSEEEVAAFRAEFQAAVAIGRVEVTHIGAELRERHGSTPFLAPALEAAVVRPSLRRRLWTALTGRRTA